ncbi:Chitin binding Peritrophin-A domain family protein [Acanthocheilonema viteae]
MQLITLLLNSFFIYFGQCDTKLVENSLDNSGDDDINSSVIWRSVIGDICQLSSLPRPTTDSSKYVECVFQAENAGNRSDLGIWVSKDCPIGYQFVAPARKCKINDFIKARQQLCDGPNAKKYKFCPQLRNSPKFMVKSVEQQKKHCSCSVDDKNCECPKVTIIELVTYNEVVNEKNTSKARQARQVVCQGQQRCMISGDNCGDCSNADGICICGPFDPTYLPSVTKLPSRHIPEGCYLLSNGQLHCSQIQEERGKQQHPAIIVPQACPIAVGQNVEGARYQRICSWMIEPLAADPESPSHFLQCQPASNSLYCGRWQRMPCTPDLIFNALLQVCAWNPSTQSEKIPVVTQRPSIIATYPSITQLPHASTGYLISPIPVVPPYNTNARCTCHGGVQIGFCGPNGQCPGQSICKSNQIVGQGSCLVCCYYSQETA